MTYTLNALQIDTRPLSQMITGNTCHAPEHVVGNTPVLWVPEIASGQGRGFWAKLEGGNPGGIKDRPGLYIVDRARDRGELRPGAPIVESTSGTFGLGLALAGIVHGHPVTLVTDPGMEPLMRRLLSAYGARVVVVTEPHPVGGWQQARRERVRELLREHPDAYCPDQYNNPDNVDGLRGAGDGADRPARADRRPGVQRRHRRSQRRVFRALRRFSPDLRLVGVDTIGSTIFGQPARPRLMRGLGSSIHPRNVAYELFSEVHWVAPPEAVWACRRLAALHTPPAAGASGRSPWCPRGWLARCPATPGSWRSFPMAPTATSTRCSTTTTASRTTFSAHPRRRPRRRSITRRSARRPAGRAARP